MSVLYAEKWTSMLQLKFSKPNLKVILNMEYYFTATFISMSKQNNSSKQGKVKKYNTLLMLTTFQKKDTQMNLWNVAEKTK